MGVYTDGVHLVGDTVAELHEFATKIDLKSCWFENHRHPHYDLIGHKVEKAIEAGAEVKTSRELVVINLKNKRVTRKRKARK